MKWSKEEEQIVIDNYPTKNYKEIASILQRTPRSVQHKMLELNLSRPKAKVGDIINGWEIIEIWMKYNGKQFISYATAKSTLGDGKIGKYRLTEFTKRTVGWPDRRRPDNKLRAKHNLSNHRLYSIWKGMKNRCYNQNQINYHNYGGRGIKICDEWLNNFLSFYNWSISNGYTKDLSIDRIDNNGDYCPENCKWSTSQYQISKRRISINIQAFGENKTADAWSLDERCKCSYESLIYRIKRGWHPEKALTKPSKRLDNFRRYKFLYKFVQEKYPSILEEFNKLGV